MVKRNAGSGRATIYDVARIAGVSASAVSRALSTPGRLNAQTEERIRAAAEELGYRLNPLARALPTGRTTMLGIVVSDFTNPVYFDFVRGVERTAAAAGYATVLMETQESENAERTAIERLGPRVDGVVVMGSRASADELRGLAARTRLALVNRIVDGVDSLVPDVAGGAEAIVEHLAALGHRTLAYVTGPAGSWMNAARWAGLQAAAARRAVALVSVEAGSATLEAGALVLPAVRATPATAVIAYNDMIAMGLLESARASGVRVPGELSVAGFDDVFGSALISPALTTVRSPLGRLGELAAQRIFALVDGVEDEAATLPPMALVARDSTGPVRPA